MAVSRLITVSYTHLDVYKRQVYVPCEECGGKRYNEETLQVTYKDKTIYDVLELSLIHILVSTQTVSGKIESFKSTDIQKYHFENGYVLCNGAVSYTHLDVYKRQII